MPGVLGEFTFFTVLTNLTRSAWVYEKKKDQPIMQVNVIQIA